MEPELSIAAIGDKVWYWQHCPHTTLLTCDVDPDHPPMEWDERGFIFCPEETCGLIRHATAINPQVLRMTHGPDHHGCVLPLT